MTGHLQIGSWVSWKRDVRAANHNFRSLEAAVAAISPLFEDCCRYI